MDKKTTDAFEQINKHRNDLRTRYEQLRAGCPLKNKDLIFDQIDERVESAFEAHAKWTVNAIVDVAYAVNWSQDALAADVILKGCARAAHALQVGREEFEKFVIEYGNDVADGMFEQRSTCGLTRGVGEAQMDAARRQHRFHRMIRSAWLRG